MQRKYIIFGIIFLFIGIILGAFGAHTLKTLLPNNPEKIISFDTGVKYQIYGAFSFLFLGLFAEKVKFSLKSVFNLLILGHLFFSCSIYLLTLQPILKVKLSFLGPITPIGGLLMVTAWILLLIKLIKAK
jgi:uncharacterized membrane protein YgdD (TMEM256/DUF423 family)